MAPKCLKMSPNSSKLLSIHHCFEPPFLSLGGLFSTGATLSSFCIISFSSILLVRTRPALYEKKPAYMFKINKFIFRPHLDMSLGVFGLPEKTNKNESWHKTDCCIVLSDFWKEVWNGIYQQFLAATGAVVSQWTRSWILKEIFL